MIEMGIDQNSLEGVYDDPELADLNKELKR